MAGSSYFHSGFTRAGFCQLDRIQMYRSQVNQIGLGTVLVGWIRLWMQIGLVLVKGILRMKYFKVGKL